MNALVCANREAALVHSQAWIDAEGLGEVAKAKQFVQKIPLNKIYYIDLGENLVYENYLFYPPHITITEGLRQEAAEINTRKLVKINSLEEQIKEIKLNMPTMPELKQGVIYND